MIIKGLFRRYQRWNPVHPTSGTFWGMGIGVGCGIGWGPGFGPQVIGYVGAGCGVGFSVGFSLLGVGIGLPTKHSIKIPNNEMRTKTVELLKSSSLCFMRNVEDGWNQFGSLIPLHKEASGKTNGFNHKGSLDHRVGITMVNPGFSSNFKSVLNCLESLRDRCLHWPKGSKD